MNHIAAPAPPAGAFSVRPVAAQEADSAAALYAGLGRDAAWATPGLLGALAKTNALWGGYCDGRLALCCPVVTDAALCLQTQALAAAAPGCAAFLPGPAFAPHAVPHEVCFWSALRIRLVQQGVPPDAVAVCAPIKTGAALLAGLFAAGFVLTAMRPLYALRPHYILRAQAVCAAASPHGCVWMPVADTLATSRLLEHGFVGTGVRQRQGALQLRLQPQGELAE